VPFDPHLRPGGVIDVSHEMNPKTAAASTRSPPPSPNTSPTPPKDHGSSDSAEAARAHVGPLSAKGTARPETANRWVCRARVGGSLSHGQGGSLAGRGWCEAQDPVHVANCAAEPIATPEIASPPTPTGVEGSTKPVDT
jgi:hypothetical protein